MVHFQLIPQLVLHLSQGLPDYWLDNTRHEKLRLLGELVSLLWVKTTNHFLCHEMWINCVMFSSLWLIADNDVWEVCQTGDHTGLPVLLDPGQPTFILLMRCHTEKMKRLERLSGHCKLIPLQLSFVQKAPNSERLLVLPANWPHHSEGSFIWGVFGCGLNAWFSLPHIIKLKGRRGIFRLISVASDPAPHLSI